MHKIRKLGRFPAMVLLTCTAWVLVWVEAQGQNGTSSKDILRNESYVMPPKAIADAVLSARPDESFTLTNISPDGKKFLITKHEGMPTVDRMGRPCVHLAELAFDHTANRSHTLYVKSSPGFDLFFYGEGRKVPVQIPEKSRVSDAAWSPDGSQLAFYVHFLESTHIYLADTTTGKSRKLTEKPVLATMVTSFQWSRDGKRIQTVLLPDNVAANHNHGAVAAGPKVRIADDGKKNPSRTFRYLLETAEDMQLLESLVTGQVVFIDATSGKVTKVGQPALLRTVSMSPGADSFRVATMKKPFTYYAPATNFGTADGIWNLEGKNIYTFATPKGKGAKGKKADDPAAQPDPAQPDPDNPQPEKQTQDPDGKRDLGWRPDGIGMSYLQLEPAPKEKKGAKDATKDQKTDKDAKDQKTDKDAKDQKTDKDAKDQKAQDQPKVVRKDRVMQWLPPWGKNDVKVVYETPHPIASVQYSDDCKMIFVTQTVEGQRQIIAVDLADPNKATYVVYKGAGGAEFDPVFDALEPQADDVYEGFESAFFEQQKKGGKGGGGFGGKGGGAGGGLLTRSNRGATQVVRISTDGEVYVTGNEKGGGSAKPFIDKVNIRTGKKARVFVGKADMAESVDAVDGDDIKIVFTSRQKKTVPPNTYMYDLASGKVQKMTENVDHNGWFHELKNERIEITREDGFKFFAKVTTSPTAGKRQPAMFWIYPKEYVDQAAYNGKGKGGAGGGGGGKGGDAKYAAPAPRAMSMLTLVGYVVVEPDVPIVGPAGKMNDNYVKDLKSSLKAVIDELDKREIIDPNRLACGGHSYGAFSTANALVHTPYFKAGIAGDGCYNRTLTPMTFQSEKRQIWTARETYLDMSPLLWADKMSGALLMYHGMWDANVGTDPINSERMYAALRGLGKQTALYMYPYEGHGPIAKETNLDLWARWTAWLDTYVTNAPSKKK